MRRNRSFFMELSQIVLLADVVVGDFVLLRRRGQRDGYQEFGAFAQFERDLIHERTQEGRRIAKEKGVKFGRKTLINKNNIAKQKSCIQLYESGTPVREIQKILNIGSSGTVYRLLRRNGIALKSESKSE